MNKFRQMEKYTEIVNILKDYHDTEQGSSYYWHTYFNKNCIMIELDMKTGNVIVNELDLKVVSSSTNITAREWSLIENLNNL